MVLLKLETSFKLLQALNLILHSLYSLLKPPGQYSALANFTHLHSNGLLKLPPIPSHLHSTMVLLKLYSSIAFLSSSVAFTFHYGLIKTS